MIDQDAQRKLAEAMALSNAYQTMAGEIQQDAVDETHEAAIKAKADADATRVFVLEHFERLRGSPLTVEISSISNIPSHSCLIVNDHLLLSYVEAEQMIRALPEPS